LEAAIEDVEATKKRNLIWGIMYLVYGFVVLLCSVIPWEDRSGTSFLTAGILIAEQPLQTVVPIATIFQLIFGLFLILSTLVMALWYLAIGALFLVMDLTAWGKQKWAKRCSFSCECCNEKISFCGCCHAFGGAGVGFIMALGSLLNTTIILLIASLIKGMEGGFAVNDAGIALLALIVICHLGAVITGCSVATSTLSYGQIMTFQIANGQANLEMTRTTEADYPDDSQLA